MLAALRAFLVLFGAPGLYYLASANFGESFVLHFLFFIFFLSFNFGHDNFNFLLKKSRVPF